MTKGELRERKRTEKHLGYADTSITAVYSVDEESSCQSTFQESLMDCVERSPFLFCLKCFRYFWKRQKQNSALSNLNDWKPEDIDSCLYTFILPRLLLQMTDHWGACFGAGGSLKAATLWAERHHITAFVSRHVLISTTKKNNMHRGVNPACICLDDGSSAAKYVAGVSDTLGYCESAIIKKRRNERKWENTDL